MDPLEKFARDYVDRWRVDPLGAVDKFVADDCVWEVSGFPTCHGKAQIMSLYQAMIDAGYPRIEGVIRSIGIGGDRVYVERIDDTMKENGEFIRDPIMSVWQVKDDKVVSWRDYWDPRHWLFLDPNNG